MDLTRAGHTLGLLCSWPEQDWGIVDADTHRMEDSAAFHREHMDDFANRAARFYLGELVLESVNDALLSNRVTERSAQEAVQAILRRRSQEPTAALLAYWMNLDQMGDVEEQERWPVCRLLRAGLDGRTADEGPLNQSR